MTFMKRGGRKLVFAPNGADAWAMLRARVENTIVKARARAGAVANVVGIRVT